MIKWVMIFMLALAAPCYAVDFTEYSESCDLVAEVGASFINAQASEESPFMGGGLNGLNYYDLDSALHAEGFCTVNAAEGGAMSYDLNGWRGYQAQIDRALAWSMWPPGSQESQIDYALVGGMNDCLHSGDPNFPCTDLQMDEAVQRAVDAARRLAGEGLCVGVTDKPDSGSWNMELAMPYYGLIGASQADVDKLRDKWYAAFMPLGNENIHLIFTWSNGSAYPDWLHPPIKDQHEAGRKIRQAFHKLCR